VTARRDDLASIPDALAALASGGIVIVVDHESRGSLVMAAQHVSAEAINFMATAGRGLICVPMRTETLDALAIPPAVAINKDPTAMAFRVSVNHAELTTTGSSAKDRTRTIQALADPASGPDDFTRPGQVFPLGYTEGGVIVRPGHAEAAIDLADLAGLSPAGVICDICGTDGELAGLPELRALARQHGLPMITLADLVEYRFRDLCRVERAGEARLPLAEATFRAIGFVDGTGREHLAVVLGDLADGPAPLVHVHPECVTGDVLLSRGCDCGRQLDQAVSRIASAGRGAIIYLRGHKGRGAGLTAKLARFARKGTAGSDLALGCPTDRNDHQVAYEILASLGVREIRLLTEPDTERSLGRVPSVSGQR
jgi:3,4-dihydroxy 2-butanone 4-phosphate synthase/GTP cyclohydrolase II